jgi:hypothetical protein
MAISLVYLGIYKKIKKNFFLSLFFHLPFYINLIFFFFFIIIYIINIDR